MPRTIHQDKVPTDTAPKVPSWSDNDTIVWSEYLRDGRTGELLEVRQEYASSGAGFEQFLHQFLARSLALTGFSATART